MVLNLDHAKACYLAPEISCTITTIIKFTIRVLWLDNCSTFIYLAYLCLQSTHLMCSMQSDPSFIVDTHKYHLCVTDHLILVVNCISASDEKNEMVNFLMVLLLFRWWSWGWKGSDSCRHHLPELLGRAQESHMVRGISLMRVSCMGSLAHVTPLLASHCPGWAFQMIWSSMLSGMVDVKFYRALRCESRNSSVGRALDWRSKGPWFDPGFRHFFLPWRWLLRDVVVFPIFLSMCSVSLGLE